MTTAAPLPSSPQGRDRDSGASAVDAGVDGSEARRRAALDELTRLGQRLGL